MTSQRLLPATIYGASILMTAALIARLYTRGGPYFQRPQTMLDHVGPDEHPLRDALLLLPRVRPLLPRGAYVACFRPVNGEQTYQMENFYAAVGQLPNQRIMPPFSAALDIPVANLVEYVVAIREPFIHPGYKVVAEFPEGRLYKVAR